MGRHGQRGDKGEVSFRWLKLPPYPGDLVINTDHKTVRQIAREMKLIIDRE